MDLIGLPWQAVVGPRGVKQGQVELKARAQRRAQRARRPRRWSARLAGLMFAPVERLIAGRYLRPRREEGFISVIAAFSLLGIALGVGTLIVVLAVMSGFRAELLGRVLGLNGHITLRARPAGHGRLRRSSPTACAAPTTWSR